MKFQKVHISYEYDDACSTLRSTNNSGKGCGLEVAKPSQFCCEMHTSLSLATPLITYVSTHSTIFLGWKIHLVRVCQCESSN